MTQPQITVGILSGKEIEFSFPVKFSSSVGTEISGTQKVIYQDGKIHWQGKEYDELSFIPPQNAHAFFELKDVTIGINFHWERKEVQKFIRDERNSFFRTTKGSRRHLPKLVTRKK